MTEQLRIIKTLLNGKDATTDDTIAGEHYLKCANLLDFEIYKVKKTRGTYKITSGKDFNAFQQNIWLSFWNEDYQREEYIFDNFFVIENSDYALSYPQFEQLKKENRIIYGGWYDENDKGKCYAIVRDANSFNRLKSKRLALWKGKDLYEAIKRKDFNSLDDVSEYIAKHQSEYLYPFYKKNEVK